MGRSSSRTVLHYGITLEDDILLLSSPFLSQVEEKLIHVPDFSTIYHVEKENANLQFLSYKDNRLFGIVSSVHDVDSCTEVYDKETHKIIDTRKLAFSYFTYFLMDVKLKKLISIYKKTAPSVSRVLNRFLNDTILLKIHIINELSEDWKDRLKALKKVDLYFSFKDNDKAKRPLAKLEELSQILIASEKISLDIHWSSPSSTLIPILEQTDRNEFATFKIKGIKNNGSSDTIDFLRDEISKKSEVEITDEELLKSCWETVENALTNCL